PAPPTQTALLIPTLSSGWAHCFSLSRNHARPTITSSDEVLIRNVCVGLNHVDFKSLLYRFGIGRLPWVLGRDVCGVVEELGGEVARDTGLKVGDRVWTCTDSARDWRAGAYQEYSVCKAFTVGRLPDAQGDIAATVSDEQAATIGTGLVTAGVALHWFFDLPRAAELGGGLYPRSEVRVPSPPPRRSSRLRSSSKQPWLLIYGGATVTGIYAAQLARLSGLKVVSVASPASFEYLRGVVRVDACVDRFGSTEQVLEDIWTATCGGVGEMNEEEEGDLKYGLDCVGSATASLCARALAEGEAWRRNRHGTHDELRREPAQLICLAGNPKRPREEEDDSATKYGHRDVITPRISFSTTFYQDRLWTASFLSSIYELLASGSLRPVEAEVVPDGLAGVRRGLEMLKDGRAGPASSAGGGSGGGGGRKLVVRVADTPPVEVTHLGQRHELGWNGCV
ncbi:GroES-like protein, partial [Jaminaea rosea]